MKTIISFAFIIIIASCSGNRAIIGTYYKKGKDFEYRLILNKDSTFQFTKSYFEANVNCKGKWKYISISEINLKCDTDNSIATALSSGPISEPQQTVKIINPNHLMVGQQVLVRTKDTTK